MLMKTTWSTNQRNVFNILRERAAVALSLMGERDKIADIRLADAKNVGTTFDDHERSVDAALFLSSLSQSDQVRLV